MGVKGRRWVCREGDGCEGKEMGVKGRRWV